MASNVGIHAPSADLAREYRWIVVLTLPAFLLVAMLGRLTGAVLRRGGAGGSVFHEARAIAHTVLPFVFTH